MAPVFGHGQLRLYLLALLESGPRSGYDVIRSLEERFGGLYSPSAGTVYPRLAKLEEEGLIKRTDEGRRSIYELKKAGRKELNRRRGELEEIEESLDEAAGRLADELRDQVRSGTQDVRTRLTEAARQAREQAERSASGPPGASGAGQRANAWEGAGPWVPPGFGQNFPFGPGGSAGSGGKNVDWVKVARWLADSGIGTTAWQTWGAPGAGSPERSRDAAPSGTRAAGPQDRVPEAGGHEASGHRADHDPQASAENTWASVSDPIPREDRSDNQSGHQNQDDPWAQAFWGWEKLLEEKLPDAEQMREISEIIRIATAQIQDVLRRPSERG